ncbi:MAG: DUF2059 domain-containing protein [Shimia sp.]|nr:DUF2059 domain-containing protein [Shimia sp.]MCP4826343.1 DUF2059 domain-containing protein [Shimia sp.]
MKHIALAALLSFSLSTAQAQTSEELAKTYVNMPEVQQMMTDMFSPQSMAAQVMASMPPGVVLSETQQVAIGELMSSEMNTLRPKLEELMEATTAEIFTAEEIDALITFYSSEHGAAIMSKMGPMMQQVMGALAPDMQTMQTRITPKMIEIMSSEY